MDLNSSSHKKKRGRSTTRPDNLNASISHAKIRNLSALGNRNYAAPEILERAKEKRSILDSSLSKRGKNKKKSEEALTKFVSDYGMDADAYSLGMVLRYALTGVPPGNNVQEYISLKNNVVLKHLKALAAVLKRGKGKKKKRKKKYRLSNNCPKEATLLVRGLTLW